MARKTASGDINDVIAALRNAYASGDAEAIERLKAEKDEHFRMAAEFNRKQARKRKPQTEGQRRYIAALKRHGYL